MESYDAIIIGGGLGGLATAATLSKEGLGVCVLEQHSTIGGCLQSFKRCGCNFDTGMHYVGSLNKGQIMHQYFKYLGVINDLKLQQLDPKGFDQFRFLDGTCYAHAAGYENFIDTLSSKFPEEAQGLAEVAGIIKRVGQQIGVDVLRSGRVSSGGYRDLSTSAYDEIARCVHSARLRSVLAGNSYLYAGNKATTSLYEYAMITHSNIEGTYAFIDGSQQLADSLVRVIEANGGKVQRNAKVDSIHLEGAHAEYVTLRMGQRMYAKWIVSSLHPAVTFSMLENNTVYKKAFFTRMGSFRNTYGIFSTYLLMAPNSFKYVNQNNYLFNNSDAWEAYGTFKGCNIPSALLYMQPNSKGPYARVLTLLTPMPLKIYEKWINTTHATRGEEYEDFKERYSEAMIDFAAQWFPTIRSCIEKKFTATPLTFRDYTGTPNGSAYGIIKDYHNPMVTLLPAKTKISNLLITGQNLNLHGCIGTAVSATVTCAEVLGEEYITKRIGNA